MKTPAKRLDEPQLQKGGNGREKHGRTINFHARPDAWLRPLSGGVGYRHLRAFLLGVDHLVLPKPAGCTARCIRLDGQVQSLKAEIVDARCGISWCPVCFRWHSILHGHV